MSTMIIGVGGNRLRPRDRRFVALCRHRPKPQMEFRVGINVGEVIVDDDDIFGDGVNGAVPNRS